MECPYLNDYMIGTPIGIRRAALLHTRGDGCPINDSQELAKGGNCYKYTDMYNTKFNDAVKNWLCITTMDMRNKKNIR